MPPFVRHDGVSYRLHISERGISNDREPARVETPRFARDDDRGSVGPLFRRWLRWCKNSAPFGPQILILSWPTRFFAGFAWLRSSAPNINSIAPPPCAGGLGRPLPALANITLTILESQISADNSPGQESVHHSTSWCQPQSDDGQVLQTSPDPTPQQCYTYRGLVNQRLCNRNKRIRLCTTHRTAVIALGCGVGIWPLPSRS